ncbi:MAG: AsmA family protein, partial [Burkholderiales bacterium]
MSSPAKSRRFLRWRHLLWVVFVKVLLMGVTLAILIYSGAADRFLRGVMVRRLEAMTGGRVELRGFEMHWRGLHATLSGLTIHGREPAGTPPFFSAEKLELDLRVDSFWGRKVSLESAVIERPQIHVRSNRDGSTNVPLPKRVGESRTLSERLFELRISRLRLNDGAILYNDVRVPLVAEGGEFRFTMDAAATVSGASAYLGQMSWRHAAVV